jgi:hypothetical protein
MQDEDGKKSLATGPVTGADDAANAPVKPTVLSDDELDGVAGGGTLTFSGTLDRSRGIAPNFTLGRSNT